MAITMSMPVLLTLAAILFGSSSTLVSAQTQAYAQLWSGTTSCSGASAGSDAIANDGSQCISTSQGGVTVDCASSTSGSSWTARAFFSGLCSGSPLTTINGMGTGCQPVSVLGYTASVLIDCSGASNPANRPATTTAPSAAASVISSTGSAAASTPMCHNAVPYAYLPAGYCASFYARGVGAPRGLYYDATANWLLTVSDSDNIINLMQDLNNDGVITGSESVQLASAPGINHGIDRLGNYLYASSDSTVYRWNYSSTNMNVTLNSQPQIVISGIPTSGHGTRTLRFSPDSQYLYVSVGSDNNVDLTIIPNRQQVKRFSTALFNGTIPAGGYDYSTNGTVFAQGLRNEVAINFDSAARLWGGMNGNDNLNRGDLGGDIHTDNPAERIDLLTEANMNKTYGYPQCWTNFNLPNKTYLEQFAMPLPYPNSANGIPPYGTVLNATDAFCQNTSLVVPPKLGLPAHSAPLGLTFYPNITRNSSSSPAFVNMTGNMFITAHGSWNRQPPTGYEVYLVTVNSSNPTQLTGYQSFFKYASSSASSSTSQWPYRPVDVAVDKQGALYVSSDATGDIFKISYVGNSFNATQQLLNGNTGIFESGTLTGSPPTARQRLFERVNKMIA